MASTYSVTCGPARNFEIGSRRIRLANAALARLWEAYPRWSACHISGGTPHRLSPKWRARPDLLLGDVNNSAGLTALGRTLAYGQLVSATANMIGMYRLWAQHPEIDAIRIERPIIIVGQMRSGTTRMQRLLACDERFRFTRFYESWAPLPRIAANKWFDDRKWRARLALIAARMINPDFQSIHPTSATAADEEIGFFNMLMLPAAYDAQWRLPRYVSHCEATDKAPIYLEFRRMLKTIAWLRRDTSERPWILKVPQFAEDLAPLLAAFPDARVVHLTRDQGAIAASSASLVLNQMTVQCGHVDAGAIEREWSRKIALRTVRTKKALSRTALPAIELSYADIERDWRSAMRRVYAMLEMPFTDVAECRMRAYLRASAKRKRHRYGSADLAG